MACDGLNVRRGTKCKVRRCSPGIAGEIRAATWDAIVVFRNQIAVKWERIVISWD